MAGNNVIVDKDSDAILKIKFKKKIFLIYYFLLFFINNFELFNNVVSATAKCFLYKIQLLFISDSI